MLFKIENCVLIGSSLTRAGIYRITYQHKPSGICASGASRVSFAKAEEYAMYRLRLKVAHYEPQPQRTAWVAPGIERIYKEVAGANPGKGDSPGYSYNAGVTMDSIYMDAVRDGVAGFHNGGYVQWWNARRQPEPRIGRLLTYAELSGWYDLQTLKAEEFVNGQTDRRSISKGPVPKSKPTFYWQNPQCLTTLLTKHAKSLQMNGDVIVSRDAFLKEIAKNYQIVWM